MNHLGIPALLLLCVGAAVATWIAGVWLAKSTDVLDDRFGLGETIGGMVLLSITGALPELAITSAVTSGHLDIAAGNLIGRVAMQTLVLVIADRFMRGSHPLSTASASLVPALEGTLVICVVGITVMSGLLPASAAVGRWASAASPSSWSGWSAWWHSAAAATGRTWTSLCPWADDCLKILRGQVPG